MTLCVCGHSSEKHHQYDEGEVCMTVTCSCLRYRKAADSESLGLQSTAVLSAGGSPEGLAKETVSPSVNEAAERLRVNLVKWSPHPELLDAALATERRNTVERIRERVAVVREGGYSVETNLPVILDEVAS